MEKLEGSVIGTVFRNEENGYSVLTVRSGRSECTVVGALPVLNPGEQGVFTGEWVEHKAYGRQFKCTNVVIQMPTTQLGIERYLASGAIRGIGASMARLIVKEFGEETMEVLAEHPEQLMRVSGIGRKKAAMIAEAEGKARALQAVYEAEARGIELINNSNPSKEYLSIKSLETYEKMANGQATKIVVPSEMQSVASLLTAAKEIVEKK